MTAQLQKILDDFSSSLEAYIAETVKAEVEKHLRETNKPEVAEEKPVVMPEKRDAPLTQLELAQHILDKVRARKK